MMSGIVGQIVGILGHGKTGDFLARVRVDDHQLGWLACNYEQTTPGLIVLHGNVLLACRNGPSRHYCPLVAIHYTNFICAGHVDKQPRSGSFNSHGLEPIGIEFHIGDLLTDLGIHNTDQAIGRMSFAAAVDDIQILAGRIVSHGIRIDGQRDAASQCVGVVLEYLDLRGLAIYDKEFVHLRKNQNIVRFLEIREGTDVLVGLEIKNLNSWIFLRGDEEPLALKIYPEMIPLARYAVHGDGLQQSKRHLLLSRGLRREDYSKG